MRLKKLGAPVAGYFTGLYISGSLLTGFTTFVAVARVFPDWPEWTFGVMPALAAFVACLALIGRESLADLWRAMDNNARVAATVLIAAVTFLAGVYPSGSWDITAALGAAQFLACFGLISPRGFARYYLVAGLTVITAGMRMDTEPALVVFAILALLLALTFAYETFFFATQHVRLASYSSPFLPLAAVAFRWIIAGGLTWGILSMIPPLAPLFDDMSFTKVESRPRGNGESFDINLLKAFLYTMGLFVLMLGLIALMRYIRRKFMRKGEGLPVEGIGVPVSAPTKLARTSGRKKPSFTGSPLERIIAAYNHFGQAPKLPEARRRDSQTPEEYALALADKGTYQRRLVDSVTQEFEKARYGGELPDEESAKQFTELVERTISQNYD
jgi:hypothetical protein